MGSKIHPTLVLVQFLTVSLACQCSLNGPRSKEEL